MRPLTSLTVLLLLSASAACSTRAPQKVEGRLSLASGGDVAGLAGFTVTLEALPEPSAQAGAARESAWGAVNPDGTFTVGRDLPDEGAAVGKYRAAITPPVSLTPEGPATKPLIDPKYHDFTTSGLEVEIVPGVNRIEWRLDSPAR